MGSTKTRLAIVAAVVVLAVPAAIALAGTATFKGKGTDDRAVKVQFTRSGGSNPIVTDFQVSNLFFVCSDGGDGRGDLTEIGQMKIKNNGKFSFRDTLELQDDIFSKIRVKGRFKSKTKVTGTTKETQTQGDLTCKAKAKWKAKKKS